MALYKGPWNSCPGKWAVPMDELVTQFYVIALVGTVESWLLGELDRTPEELIAFADVMLKDHIRGAALRIQGKSALL